MVKSPGQVREVQMQLDANCLSGKLQVHVALGNSEEAWLITSDNSSDEF